MKNKIQLGAFTILMLLVSTVAHCQDMHCERKQAGHTTCFFTDGSVIDTFSSPGHYAQYHFSAAEWQCASQPTKAKRVACQQKQADAAAYTAAHTCSLINDPLSPACDKQRAAEQERTQSAIDGILHALDAK